MTDGEVNSVPKTPYVGARVQYTLSTWDADAINAARVEHNNFLSSGLARVFRTGHLGHVGNVAVEGDIVAADIVRVFSELSPTVNLQLIPDGNHGIWKTSASHGFTPGKWHWIGETAPVPAPDPTAVTHSQDSATSTS